MADIDDVSAMQRGNFLFRNFSGDDRSVGRGQGYNSFPMGGVRAPYGRYFTVTIIPNMHFDGRHHVSPQPPTDCLNSKKLKLM